jgi:hypothetical protein
LIRFYEYRTQYQSGGVLLDNAFYLPRSILFARINRGKRTESKEECEKKIKMRKCMQSGKNNAAFGV